jgi:hypothetical protein
MLTEDQKNWIVKHFKNTKNDVIIEKLGINHSSLHRFARLMGLKKTKQFQKKCQAHATSEARKANQRNNWPPKGYKIPRRDEFSYKPGVTPEQRLGKKRNAERIRTSAAKRRETLKAEKRRVLFGLEQKTKLKVVAAPHKKVSYRYVLKKRGYIVTRGSNVVYYDSNTSRSERAERTATEKYRFIIKEAC